jgi:hypothetical protein
MTRTSSLQKFLEFKRRYSVVYFIRKPVWMRNRPYKINNYHHRLRTRGCLGSRAAKCRGSWWRRCGVWEEISCYIKTAEASPSLPLVSALIATSLVQTLHFEAQTFDIDSEQQRNKSFPLAVHTSRRAAAQ